MLAIAGKVIERPEGLREPVRRLATGFVVVPIHWRDDPDHDEAWADERSMLYGGRHTVAWQREMEIELVRGGSPVWPMLDREVHVWRKPYRELLTDDWTLYRGLDPGTRHPTCCAWMAIHRGRGRHEAGDRYFYRQYYATDLPAAVNAWNILQATPADESIAATVADPAAWQRSKTDARTPAEIYAENGLPLVRADNSRTGYDWLTQAFMAALARWSIWNGYRVHPKLPASLTRSALERLAAHPAVWFHPECADGSQSLFEQCANLRWKDVGGQVPGPERIEDRDKDGPDVVRYLCQTPSVVWQRRARQAIRPADLALGQYGRAKAVPARMR